MYNGWHMIATADATMKTSSTGTEVCSSWVKSSATHADHTSGIMGFLNQRGKWNPRPRRQAFYNFREDSDSAIPGTLRIHDRHIKYTAFLGAYIHHLHITLEVRHCLGENFEQGRPTLRPRYRYKLGDKRISYGANIQDGQKFTSDFLLVSVEAQ